jgi:hypothetical protein
MKAMMASNALDKKEHRHLQGSDPVQSLNPAYDLVAESASAIQLAGEMNTENNKRKANPDQRFKTSTGGYLPHTSRGRGLTAS